MCYYQCNNEFLEVDMNAPMFWIKNKEGNAVTTIDGFRVEQPQERSDYEHKNRTQTR